MYNKTTMITSKKEAKRLPIIFPIDLHSFAETASGGAPTEIQVMPVGKWNHPAYGPIVITTEDISEFKRNFDNGLRKGIPITEGHPTFGEEKPARAWFTELIDRGANGLYAAVEWSEQGKTLLAEKAYKFFSPEFYTEYEDPETREIFNNVLVAGALTNHPYFKGLKAVVMSENLINNKLNFNDNMNLQEVLAKKVDELTDDEKAFLVENKSQLDEAQLATFGSVFEKEETPEEKVAREKEEGDANEAKGLNRDGSAKDAPTELTAEEKAANVEKGLNEDGTAKDAPAELTAEEKAANVEAGKNEDGSEKEAGAEEAKTASEFKTDGNGNVVMTMAEAKTLATKAQAGYVASEQLRKDGIQTATNKLVFSEQNSKGRILPKHEQKVFSFMLGLTESQRKSFAEIVEGIPTAKIFDEQGHGHNAEGSAFNEIDARAQKMMSENTGLTYGDAVSKVCSEDKDLASRYETELA